MNSLEQALFKSVSAHLFSAYNLIDQKLEFQSTRKDFEGDITLVLFPLLKIIRQNSLVFGEKIGSYLKEHSPYVSNYNVVGGFLNLTISDSYYLSFLNDFLKVENYGHNKPQEDSPIFIIEFSSPNTNKPLHLGHIRNNLLGHSVSKILEANGKLVIKTQIINDRGIHICKSMFTWLKYGSGETPKSSGIKGDQLVGKYYVMFEAKYREQVALLVTKGIPKDDAEKKAPIILEAQKMLRQWENNDPDIRKLWSQMNKWVYDGFEATYRSLGIDFDSYYYES